MKKDGSSKLRSQIMKVDFLLTAICFTLLAASAHAATVQNFVGKFLEADAEWSQQTDLCTFSEVSAGASQFQQGGVQTTSVTVFTLAFDTCGAGTYTSTIGISQSGQLSTTGVHSAALTATVPTSGCSYDGTSFFGCADHTVDINLSLTATAPAVRTVIIDRNQGAGGMLMSRITATAAPAVGTGTIRQDGTIDLVSGPSQYGNISFDSGGTLTIVK